MDWHIMGLAPCLYIISIESAVSSYQIQVCNCHRMMNDSPYSELLLARH